jgi:cell wall-associated NlpC family hydrolase
MIAHPLAPAICRLAKKEIGVEEVDGTNTGPRVNLYKAATNLPPEEPWPWCAAFVDWVVREAMKEEEAKGRKFTFARPTTAGAWDLENWSKRQDNSTQTKRYPGNDIEPGDIVIFTFSHVGIAIGRPRNGYFDTVEGNTDSAGSREGGGVYDKIRKVSQVKARIRFTV